MRMARYHGANQQYYSAISTLLEVQREAGKDFKPPKEYWEMLANYQLAYGLHDRAEKTYKIVLDREEPDPVKNAKFKLRLSEFEYQRGYLDLARSSMLRAKEGLPKALDNQWKELFSRILMAQGRFNEVIDLLDEFRDDAETEMFVRYNLGVAMIKNGQLPAGRSLLDRVGRTGGDSDVIRSLRDRANVTLGWHFLQQQLGGSAKPVLMRVRSEGAYANRALLGLGWAELAPRGERQLRGNAVDDEGLDSFGSVSSLGVLLRRGYLEDPYDRAGIHGFRRSRVADDVSLSLRRALVPWIELIDRDPQDPAVQEAWLAVPFALDRLGAHTQAVKFYEQAAGRLEDAYKRTLRAIRSIRGGRMVETIIVNEIDREAGWEWELRDLPDAPETYYLQTLLAEHRFAETLKQYRDIRQVSASMGELRALVKQIDESSKASDRRSVSADKLVQRARQGYEPSREKMDLSLRQAQLLASPGSYAAPLRKLNLTLTGLKLSDMPSKFDGAYERLISLNKRGDSLIDPLQSAAQAAAARLRKMAIDELDAQKKKIDNYLVESRFALARLYDSAIPDADQDEFEIDAEGNQIRTPRLQSGEFEIDKEQSISEQLQKRRPPPTTRAEALEEEEFEVK